GAIEAAGANAERAGVRADIEFAARAISGVDAGPGPGLVATNPPYGVREGERHEIRNLYAQLGHVARRQFAGWRLAMYSPDAKLTAQLGFPMRTALRTSNGGIPVAIDVGEVPKEPEPARVYF